MSFHPYVSFKGQTQGVFKADPFKTSRRPGNWTELIAFKMGQEVPYDANTGKPRGSRTHQPVTITKEMDSASPLLFRANSVSTVFDEVVMEIVGRPASGAGEIVTQRITLTNAVISSVKNYAPNLGGARPQRPHSKYLIEISLEYEKVDFRVF